MQMQQWQQYHHHLHHHHKNGASFPQPSPLPHPHPFHHQQHHPHDDLSLHPKHLWSGKKGKTYKEWDRGVVSQEGPIYLLLIIYLTSFMVWKGSKLHLYDNGGTLTDYCHCIVLFRNNQVFINISPIYLNSFILLAFLVPNKSGKANKTHKTQMLLLH